MSAEQLTAALTDALTRTVSQNQQAQEQQAQETHLYQTSGRQAFSVASLIGQAMCSAAPPYEWCEGGS